MKLRPLEYGETLAIRVELDRMRHRFFNDERFTEVKKAEAIESLERSMNKCLGCPHSKISIEQEVSHDGRAFVEGRAVCEATKDSHLSCPAFLPESGYLSTPTSSVPDWIADAERDASEVIKFASPRGRGKSSAAKVFRDGILSKEPDLQGWSESKPSESDFEKELEEIVSEVKFEQDLDEVVEFETNRSKYDNFGSW